MRIIAVWWHGKLDDGEVDLKAAMQGDGSHPAVKAGTGSRTLRLVALAMSVSSLISVGQYFLLREPLTLFQQSGTVWSLSLVNATLCTVVPVFLTMFGVARAGAGNAAQAGCASRAAEMACSVWPGSDWWTSPRTCLTS